MLCPDASCKAEISDLDLKELLSEEDYEKYSAFALNSAVAAQKDLSWCPTADCSYAFVLDKDQTEFECPTCKKHYCMACRVPFHEGLSCETF